MGWFWTSNTTAGNDDPTKHLDSGLKDYLKRESPAAYQLPQVAEADFSSASSSSQPKTDPASAPASPNSPSDEASTKGVPSESLFQDGRYAHLWKTYQPLEVVEKQGATSSGAEKVIEQFKKRKARLNETALENCAEEHEALSLCFKRGGVGSKVWARVTLCRDENAKFSRCYTMQAKFLQALGYASSLRSNAETEERIQMHADKLYHQMLDYERRVEECKAAGGPIPPPESLFHPDASPSPSTPSESSSAENEKYEVPGGETLPPGMRFSKPASKLTPHERELEIRVARQQLEQRELYKTEVNDLLVEEEEAKRLRQKKMSSWFGETVGKWLS